MLGIATIVKPGMLLVDAILAIGDHVFQEKCKKRMESLMSGRTTVVFSRSVEDVKQICKHTAWINKGNLEFVGSSQAVFEH